MSDYCKLLILKKLLIAFNIRLICRYMFLIQEIFNYSYIVKYLFYEMVVVFKVEEGLSFTFTDNRLTDN